MLKILENINAIDNYNPLIIILILYLCSNDFHITNKT